MIHTGTNHEHIKSFVQALIHLWHPGRAKLTVINSLALPPESLACSTNDHDT
jgi:hypothetical protein